MKILILFIMAFSLQAKVYTNIDKVCDEVGHWSLKAYQEHVSDVDLALFQNSSAEQIFSAFLKSSSDRLEIVPWYLYNSPKENVKKSAFLLQEDNVANNIKKFVKKDVKESTREYLRRALEKGLETSEQYHLKNVKYFNEQFDKIQELDLFEEKYQELKKMAWAMCLPYLAFNCPKALLDAYHEVHPKVLYGEFGTTSSFSHHLKNVYGSPRFQKALSRMALKIYDNIERVENGKKLRGDFFYDLVDSFFTELDLNTEEEAKSLAFKYIALYSSRGASIIDHKIFFHQESYPTLVALNIISGATQLFDYYRQQKGKSSYSYPSDIKLKCNFGRAYHFWMGAYLGQFLKKKGHTDRTAVVVPHLLGYLYEFGTGFGGKNEFGNILSPLYSNQNNSVRLSVAWNDVGAKWGANYEDAYSKSIDFNSWAERHFDKAKKVSYNDLSKYKEKLSTRPLFRFFEWRKVIAPDANYIDLHKMYEY